MVSWCSINNLLNIVHIAIKFISFNICHESLSTLKLISEVNDTIYCMVVLLPMKSWLERVLSVGSPELKWWQLVRSTVFMHSLWTQMNFDSNNM